MKTRHTSKEETKTLCTKTKEVILSILRGYLGNPNKQKKRIMSNIVLDTWSDTSYITSAMAEALELNIHSSKDVTLFTLDNVIEKTYPRTKVVLMSAQANITIEVSVSENIVSLNNIGEWKKAEKMFPNLKFRGLESIGKVKIDLLIGMDFMNQIRGTEIIRVGELEARSSLLGYYLEGRFDKNHNEESSTLTAIGNADNHTIMTTPS